MIMKKRERYTQKYSILFVHVFNQTIKRQTKVRVSTRNEKQERKKCITKKIKSYVKEKK